MLDFAIFVALPKLLGDGFGHTVEHPLQIVGVARGLHLHNEDFAIGVLRLYVNAVKLVFVVFLIALALQNFLNLALFAKKHLDEAFEDVKILLVAEHILNREVEAHEKIFFHNSPFLSLTSSPQR